MQWWSRQAEFTADRAGLLACRDIEAAVSTLAKLAVGADLYQELNLPALIKQVLSARSDHLSYLSEAMRTHPAVATRIQAVAEYYHSDEYRELTAMGTAAY